MKKKLIIFDRDGTLNSDEFGYAHLIKDCFLFEDVYELFSSIDTFIHICVVTNQSGVGRGFYSEKKMHEFNSEINRLIRLKTKHRGIDHFFFCPHSPSENCNCRKPKNTLVKKALKYFSCKPPEALLIGDKYTDYMAGKSAGVESLIIERKVNLKVVDNNKIRENIINSLAYCELEKYLK